jgi:hypothetical protein
MSKGKSLHCQVCYGISMMIVTMPPSKECLITLDNKFHEGQVLSSLNIGDQGILNFRVCTKCGQMAGKWPLILDGVVFSTKGQVDSAKL